MMTLSSIIADVHELQAHYGPCQLKLPQRLYIYSTLASTQIFRTVGFLAAQI